jgi:hypothetical protein
VHGQWTTGGECLKVSWRGRTTSRKRCTVSRTGEQERLDGEHQGQRSYGCAMSRGRTESIRGCIDNKQEMFGKVGEAGKRAEKVYRNKKRQTREQARMESKLQNRSTAVQ